MSNCNFREETSRAETCARPARALANPVESRAPMIGPAPHLDGIPDDVCASASGRRGEYDLRRLRSQREVIRDVMLSAAGRETWLTLAELRAVTRYGEASISAQLRHLRKAENGGYEIEKRHREGAAPARPGGNGRAECVWEYRISPAGGAQNATVAEAQRVAVGA